MIAKGQGNTLEEADRKCERQIAALEITLRRDLTGRGRLVFGPDTPDRDRRDEEGKVWPYMVCVEVETR